MQSIFYQLSKEKLNVFYIENTNSYLHFFFSNIQNISNYAPGGLERLGGGEGVGSRPSPPLIQILEKKI